MMNVPHTGEKKGGPPLAAALMTPSPEENPRAGLERVRVLRVGVVQS